MSDLLRGIAQLSPEQRAKVLALARKKRGLSTEPVLRRIKRQGRYPMSTHQHRMWFMTQLELGSPFYNGPDRLRIKGGFNVATWQQTLDEMERRQEIWRTSFEMSDEGPEQIVHRSWDAPMPCVDLSGLDQSKRESTAKLLYFAFGKQNYYPEHGPLMHNYVCRLDDGEYEWGFTRQHLHNDWPSDEVIMLDWERTYHWFFAGEPSQLPELEIQQVDFSVWYHQWFTGKKYDKELDYWRKRLANLPAETTLPYDRPRPEVYDFEGRIQHYTLSGETWNSFKALGREEGVTDTMLQLAVTSILMMLWTGQEEASIAQQIDTRNRRQLEPMGGFMVNTIVTRIGLENNPTCRELLRRTKVVNQEAWDNRHIPFQDLVKEINPARSLSRTPLFQVFFTVLNQGLRLPQFPRCETSSDYEAHEKALFDLTALTFEFGDIFRFSWEYSNQLFDATTILRWSQQWKRLLEAMVENPDARVLELSPTTEEERHQLFEWNDTKSSGAVSIAEGLARQVASVPDAIAVVGDGVHLSYSVLSQRIAALAARLGEAGVGPETAVGVCLDRSPEWVVAMLAILKVGGVYLPLDPEHPIERRTYMLDNAAASVVISDPVLEGLCSGHRSTLFVDTDPAPSQSFSTCGSNLAYVIYTSGTTGAPKGVAVNLNSLQNHLLGFADAIPLTHRDRVLQFALPTFDVSLEEVLPTLLAGATVVLRPGCGVSDPMTSVVDEAVTVLNLPSPLWRQWLGLLLEHQIDLPASLRSMIVGSEKLLPADAEAWHGLTDQVPLFNLYGPTETTITATSYRAPVTIDSGCKTLPVGKSLANVTGSVVNSEGTRVPLGLPGVLKIGGEGVARGYLGQSYATARCFTCDHESGARTYETGDRFRRRRDGNLEFMGRADRQVKIRGFRIELAEIEATLAEHSKVSEVAVVVEDGDRLIAYVAADAVTPEELGAYVATKLPSHMVPSQFVVLPALPLTVNGKLDRDALPAPDDLVARHCYSAPRNHIEETVAKIWSRVLSVERVGLDDNFFSLGGHSLAAINVVWQLRSTLGVDLPVRVLFQASTLASLCEYLADDHNLRL